MYLDNTCLAEGCLQENSDRINYRRGDLLEQVIEGFNHLLQNDFHFVLCSSKKGKLHFKNVILRFEKENFHHLAGIHYLKDNLKMIPSHSKRLFEVLMEPESPSKKRIWDAIIHSSFVMDIQSRWVIIACLAGNLINPTIKIWTRTNQYCGMKTKIKYDLLLEIPSPSDEEKELYSYIFFKEDATIAGLYHPVSAFQTGDPFSINQKNWKIQTCSLLTTQYQVDVRKLFPNALC